MNDHATGHLAAEEQPPPIDAVGALDVTGPTFKQELFLRRQKLWNNELTRKQASQIIGDFLAKKHAERQMKPESCRKGPENGVQRA